MARKFFSATHPLCWEDSRSWRLIFSKITAFLPSRGLTQFAAQPVQIHDITAKQDSGDDTTVTTRVGYRLTQTIEVRSADVEGLPKLAGNSGEWLQPDIAFVSDGFEFICTNAGNAKVEMMAEATKGCPSSRRTNRHPRGRKIKQPRNARRGCRTD